MALNLVQGVTEKWVSTTLEGSPQKILVIAPQADVEVRKESNGAKVALYADREGKSPLFNPVKSDDFGRVEYYTDTELLRSQVTDAEGNIGIFRYASVGKFPQHVSVESDDPYLELSKSDAALDEKRSRIIAVAASVKGQLSSDDAQTLVDWFEQKRDGTALKELLFFASVLGLGSVPTLAWGANRRVLQIGPRLSVIHDSVTKEGGLANNAYYDGADWRRIEAAPASLVWVPADGTVKHYVAATGAANSVITWTLALDALNSGVVTAPATGPAAGANSLWNQSRYFESADLTMPSVGGTTSVAHGLGGQPILVLLAQRCVTAELGYSVGDEVWHPSAYINGSDDNGLQVVADATNVVVVGGQNFPGAVMNKGTGVVTAITPGNWRVKIKAFR